MQNVGSGGCRRVSFVNWLTEATRGNGIGEGSPGCTDAPSPATDKDCADFPSQAAAQAELERDPTDPHRLDADSDRQACEDFGYVGGSPDDGPDDHQYNTDGKEVTVIVETIPDKKLKSGS